MTLRAYIAPRPAQIAANTGIGRVVHAQYRYLPALGIELVERPEQAEVIAAHTNGDGLPRLDVLHLHGLYWTGDVGSGIYHKWHHEINGRIAADARRAHTITVPSDWVAAPFRRDMRIAPVVIGHGIDLDAWDAGATNDGYVLWNKSRAADVCDPGPAYALAERGVDVVATFAPPNARPLDTLRLTGPLPHAEMRALIRHADLYLATTKETFGIGTLEALACGVPVLGYNWGGTADIVEHRISGYLVDPGDEDGLVQGLDWLRAHRAIVGVAARARAEVFAWARVMPHYADLYHQVVAARASARTGVAVIITNYNYGQYLPETIASVHNQTRPPDEIIVVDDGSTDDSLDGFAELYPDITLIDQPNQGVAAARNNGIDSANQPYIICLDADDRLDPHYIERLLPAFEADAALGIAYTGLGLIRADGTINPSTTWPPPFDWTVQASGGTPPGNCIPSAAMFRRALWERAGGYQQQYAPGEDAEFWIRGLACGFTARRVTRAPLFHYRAHAQGAHLTRPYVPIDTWHPWMADRVYPLAAPADAWPIVRSYSAPAISAIVVHDAPATLDRLLGQTVRAWEAIVVGGAPLAPCYVFARRAVTLAQARRVARAPIVVEATPALLDTPRALEAHLEEYMMSKRCCGGSGGAAVLAAKQALAVRQEGHGMESEIAASGPVRMEFIGMRTGSVSFRVNGQTYRGGNNAVDKYASARSEDVAGLERTGQWRQVQRRAAQQAAPTTAPPTKTIDEAPKPRRRRAS